MAQLEKRKNTRVRFLTRATLRFPNQLYPEHETRDLSMRGIFVEDVSGVKPGARCQVELHLTGRDTDLLLKMKAEVVRIEEDGVGLQFYDIEVDSFSHLKKIVSYNVEDADLVDQELINGFKPEN